MAVFSWYSGDPFSYEMDEQPFIQASSSVASDVSTASVDFSSDVFVGLANLRRVSQRKTFDFGWWYTRYVLPDAIENIEELYGEPVSIAFGTLGLIAGWSPLFATTLLAYTNPYTAGPAFALDAYNIYRYLD
jgi:hypothetical protein